MHETFLTLLGVLVGFGLSVVYERLKERRKLKILKGLLRRELNRNVESLREELAILKEWADSGFGVAERPTITEIAQRIERACDRTCFESLRGDLPLLDSENVEHVFRFYDRSLAVPRSFLDIERFGGNVRAGLFEDNIEELIKDGQAALKTLGPDHTVLSLS